ncbi:folylpolyglutamate synthase/dihydrofolate synthase family protein [Selenomonas sp. F0473]|uniref:bifunctional folylpolyglutamate synthase/dihydrofolate synthase n=1 Tax=Selenomonas sp. F0473 TaxID=999423 RepID=UPI00029E6064|nr:folylpolyglutamate synthase/dihydrofolate synthase family protein [Selenomonas sp. F0473]EKU72235.1 FolC protein [Selenomonas sp. F0473]
MDYQQSLAYLDELNTFGIRLGLSRMENLCARLGNPERAYQTIHVAGTNGKGSVTQMLDAVYRAAGIRCGRYLSPHLVAYTERVSVGGEDISEERFAALLTRVRRAADAMVADGHEHPTQFEELTALAFLYFAEEKVEVAVIETGLGGLLDSTNVIDPVLTIITNVAMDHADRCGGTLAGIAEHKAGIIKEGVPLITAASGEPLEIILARAEEMNADVFVYGEDFSGEMIFPAGGGQSVAFHSVVCREPAPFDLALAGTYQAENAALVIMAAQLLEREDARVTEAAVRTALRTVRHPARFELLSWAAGTAVVDGAHNPAGMAALRAGLDAYFPEERRVFLLGILRDKDIDTMLSLLLRPGDAVVTARPNSDRAAGADVVAAVAAAMGLETVACGDMRAALVEAERRARDGRLLVVCGSLYLVGSVRRLLRASGR